MIPRAYNPGAGIKRLLVTGASGLLGLNLCLDAVRTGGLSVVGVVHHHPLAANAPFPTRALDLLQLSEREIASLLEEIQPDAVIHCAAAANLDYCEANPEIARQVNGVLPGLLAGAARRSGVQFVHISTDCVFDGQRGDYVELDTPNPVGVYAATKLMGEHMVAEANPEAIIARVNFYGWSLQGKRSLAEFFFNNLSGGQQVKGFTDVLFCPLLANDLGRLLLQMLNKHLSGLYHVVSRQHLSKYDFGVALANTFGLDAGKIIPVSVAQAGLAARRSPLLTLRVDKLARDLGAPLPEQAQGLQAFYEQYQQGYPSILRSLAIDRI